VDAVDAPASTVVTRGVAMKRDGHPGVTLSVNVVPSMRVQAPYTVELVFLMPAADEPTLVTSPGWCCAVARNEALCLLIRSRQLAVAHLPATDRRPCLPARAAGCTSVLLGSRSCLSLTVGSCVPPARRSQQRLLLSVFVHGPCVADFLFGLTRLIESSRKRHARR
jgi:hypothetical protein